MGYAIQMLCLRAADGSRHDVRIGGGGRHGVRRADHQCHRQLHLRQGIRSQRLHQGGCHDEDRAHACYRMIPLGILQASLPGQVVHQPIRVSRSQFGRLQLRGADAIVRKGLAEVHEMADIDARAARHQGGESTGGKPGDTQATAVDVRR